MTFRNFPPGDDSDNRLVVCSCRSCTSRELISPPFFPPIKSPTSFPLVKLALEYFRLCVTALASPALTHSLVLTPPPPRARPLSLSLFISFSLSLFLSFSLSLLERDELEPRANDNQRRVVYRRWESATDGSHRYYRGSELPSRSGPSGITG